MRTDGKVQSVLSSRDVCFIECLTSAENHAEQMALTFWTVVVGNGHVPVQSDSDNTTLRGFKLIAVYLHRESVRQDQMMSDAANEVGKSVEAQEVASPTPMVPSRSLH